MAPAIRNGSPDRSARRLNSSIDNSWMESLAQETSSDGASCTDADVRLETPRQKSAVPESFSALLGHLAVAHERELAEGLKVLQQENARLRSLVTLDSRRSSQGMSANNSQGLNGHTPRQSQGPHAGDMEFHRKAQPHRTFPVEMVKMPSLHEPPNAPGGAPPLLQASYGMLLKSPTSASEKEEAPHRLASKRSSHSRRATLLPEVKAPPSPAKWPRSFRVTILAASSLRQADWTILGSRDPNAYCVCEVLGRPDTRAQTQVSHKSTDPTWNMEHTLSDLEKADTVIFTIFDKPNRQSGTSEELMASSDGFLGQATISAYEIGKLGPVRDVPLQEVGDGISSSLRIRVEEDGTETTSEYRTSTVKPLQDGASLDFDLRSVWNRPAMGVSTLGRTSVQANREEDGQWQELPVSRSASCVRHFISPPGSHWRLCWDVFGAVLILYDSLVIPLQVFDIPQSKFSRGTDICTMVFWTINIFTSMFVGFFRKGSVEMRLSQIVLRYLTSWFLIDLAVVVPDWYFTLFEAEALEQNGSQSGAQTSIKMLRIVRLVRTIRLIRLFKLRWILAAVNERLSSESASIMANIIKMITMLLFINHFIACMWFLVADMQAAHVPTWITEHGFLESSWDYQYLTSLHWSITQFTPASMHVQPHNSWERIFAITVVVFALVGFSYLVGSITNSLSQLRSMQEDHSKQFWSLRRYLKTNQVSRELSQRIHRYLEHAWQRQRAQVSEPALMGLLSEQLRNELQCERCIKPLVIHPLFDRLNFMSEITVQRLAVRAIYHRYLARSDWLFFPNEIATHVYFVISGRLRYVKASTNPNQESKLEWVDGNEDWISEPVLWTPTWVHLGTLQATTEAELLLVGGEEFGDIVSLTPSVLLVVRTYAQRFLAWTNSMDFEDLSDISQGEDITEILRGFIMRRNSNEKASSVIAGARASTRIRTRPVWTRAASNGSGI